MTIVILLVIGVALFSVAYASKRRFGVLGLGLAAGVILTQELSKLTAEVLERNAVPVAPLSYQAAASVFLTLLPALLLLTGGPSYIQKKAAVFGSIGFALLATLLIIGPLTLDLPTVDDGVREVLNLTATWQSAIISIGVAASVVDVMLAHGPKLPGRKSKH